MAVVASTVLKPLSGKRSLAEEHMKNLASVLGKYGANAKTTNFVAGEYTGCIGLIRSYPDFKTASSGLGKLANDPEYIALRNSRETDPAGEILVSRNVGRIVFGEAKWSNYPVSMVRKYKISRTDVPDALSILESVKKITDKEEVNLRAILPVLSEDMTRMLVSYQYKTLDHFGEALDGSGSSEEMQDLIRKANKFSSLQSSSLMVVF